MRKRKSKYTSDNIDVVSSAMEQKINQLTNEINSKQTEINDKYNKITKLDGVLIQRNKELADILTSIGIECIQLEIKKQSVAEGIESMRTQAVQAMLKEEDKLKMKQDIFTKEQIYWKEVLRDNEQKLEESNKKIAEQDEYIKDRLQDLSQAETSYKIVKDNALKEQEITKSLIKELDKQKSALALQEKDLFEYMKKVNKQEMEYQNDVVQLIADRESFEEEKQNIIKQTEGFKAKQDDITKRENDMKVREDILAREERVLEIDRMDIAKTKQDLIKMQRDIEEKYKCLDKSSN